MGLRHRFFAMTCDRQMAGCDCNRPTLRTRQRGDFLIDDVADGELPKAPPFVRPLIIAGQPARPTPSPPVSPD